MPNNAAWDTATTDPANRATQAVSLSVAARAAAVAPVIGGQGDFYDDFEGGESAETDFFRWAGGPQTEVVSTGPTLSGSESLRFIYYGDPEIGGGGDSSLRAEQKFQLKENLTDFWMQYYEYIPPNYTARGTATSGGRKVLAIYSDGYSLSGGVAYPTFVIGATPRSGTYGSNESWADYAFQTQDPASSPGTRRFELEGIDQVDKVLIDPVIDAGHWQRRTLHLRMPTSEAAKDGVIEFWVQRQAETTSPMMEEKIIEKLNGNFYDANRNYLNKGYLLGYANAGFEETTEFYIDNFSIGSSAESIGRGDLA